MNIKELLEKMEQMDEEYQDDDVAKWSSLKNILKLQDLHAVEHSMQTDTGRDTDKKEYTGNSDAVWFCPQCEFLIDYHFDKCHVCDSSRPANPIIYELALIPAPRG